MAVSSAVNECAEGVSPSLLMCLMTSRASRTSPAVRQPWKSAVHVIRLGCTPAAIMARKTPSARGS